MEVNKALVETEAEERKNRERDNILRAIESGESSSGLTQKQSTK